MQADREAIEPRTISERETRVRVLFWWTNLKEEGMELVQVCIHSVTSQASERFPRPCRPTLCSPHTSEQCIRVFGLRFRLKEDLK